VVITAEFDDGEPASYAQVKIYSPDGGQIEYQNGRTDKNGCFAFLPDRPGEWNITIVDGMGHRIQTEFVADEASEIRKKQDTGGPFPKWQGIVTGLGLILGISGFIMYFRARKLHRLVR
jgi:nickel transport protein